MRSLKRKRNKNPMGKVGNVFPTAWPKQSHNLGGLKIKRSIYRYVTDTKIIIKVESLRTEMNKLHMTVYGSRAFIPTAKYLHSLSLPLSLAPPSRRSSSLERSSGGREKLGDNSFPAPPSESPGELSRRLAPPNVNTLFSTSSYIVLLY